MNNNHAVEEGNGLMEIGSKDVSELYKQSDKLTELIEKEGELVTIIFIDLTGSTAYKDKKGLIPGVGKVLYFNQKVSEIINRLGKKHLKEKRIQSFSICKYIGDEVMAYFKGDNSSIVALQIAQEIELFFRHATMNDDDAFEWFLPKIGVDFGKVLFIKYNKTLPLDPHGLIVDRAARITSLAKPCQILVSEDVKNNLKGINLGKFNLRLSSVTTRKLKGIGNDTKIYEVIWSHLGEFGIKPEEEPLIFISSADEPTVYNFIKKNNLIAQSQRIDLFLYTYETLAASLREDLESSKNPLTLRVLIRNPEKDIEKEPLISSSIMTMKEVITNNPQINFQVRFYDEEPLLRSYIFHKANSESEGLLGLYRYDPTRLFKFIGAENNQLIHAQNRSNFEKQLLEIYQSRFDFAWEKYSNTQRRNF